MRTLISQATNLLGRLMRLQFHTPTVMSGELLQTQVIQHHTARPEVIHEGHAALVNRPLFLSPVTRISNQHVVYVLQILPLSKWHPLNDGAPAVRIRQPRFADHVHDVVASFDGSYRRGLIGVEKFAGAGLSCADVSECVGSRWLEARREWQKPGTGIV